MPQWNTLPFIFRLAGVLSNGPVLFLPFALSNAPPSSHFVWRLFLMHESFLLPTRETYAHRKKEPSPYPLFLVSEKILWWLLSLPPIYGFGKEGAFLFTPL